MNPLIRLIRWMAIIILSVFILSFGSAFVFSLLNILTNGLTGIDSILLVGGGGITALCVWRLRSYLKKKSGFDQRYEKNKNIAAMGKALRAAKSCPDCGARLAICEKNDNPNIIRLNTVNHTVENEYYCPSCEKHLDISLRLKNFVPEERELPQQTGTRYGVLKTVQNKHLRLFAIFASVGVLSAVHTARLLTSSIHQGTVHAILSGAVVSFGLIAIMSLYFAYLFYMRRRACIALCYELVEDGVMLQERTGKHFYAWEDFRIVTLMPEYQGHRNTFIFDLKQRVITIDEGIERHSDLAYGIVDHIRQTAQIDFRV